MLAYVRFHSSVPLAVADPTAVAGIDGGGSSSGGGGGGGGTWDWLSLCGLGVLLITRRRSPSRRAG